MISPGKTIGILGGGPTARLLTLAASRLGYRVAVFSAQRGSLAGAVAWREVSAPLADVEALAAFARECDVLTSESEHIPVEPLWKIEKLATLLPHWNVLEVSQSRIHEKNWLRKNSFAHTPFAEVEAGGDLAAAVRRIGPQCVVKAADGSVGPQAFQRASDDASALAAAATFSGRRVIVEKLVDFKCELSVAVARSADGEIRAFPVGENIFTRNRLEFSIVPARINAAVASEVTQVARSIAEKLALVGLVTVRFFLSDRGEILVNGFAPRPHPCSHYTLGAYNLSHAEQHIRAICGLPLGSPGASSPAASVVVTPEAAQGRELPWEVVLRDESAVLVCHGLGSATGELGTFTVRAGTVEAAIEHARVLKARLLRTAG